MIKYLVLAFLSIDLITSQKPPRKPSPRLTLTGQRPVIVARGGFSGLFPDSTYDAYKSVSLVSLANTILYCDLQMTKDRVGLSQSELRLDNCTNIFLVFPHGKKTYTVNGKEVHGWFALDYFAKDLLNNVTTIQGNLARTNAFDFGQPLLRVEDVSAIGKPPPQVWLNVQYDMFYNQHKISPSLYLQDMRFKGINYISSPEIGFLKSISAKVDKNRVKLIFSFLEPEAVEPTTKQTYGMILKNLAAIKPFASGILVPKTYIWPVSMDMYLMPPTTLVTDAHKEGLQVYASGFASDRPGSYNYSYDASAEYLQFIDNGHFSVDGVLTDFPSTASAAIACLAHNKNATKPKGKTMIISHNGANGDYAGCTDLAYEKAVMDGADIIDCSVKMSKDGVAFCLGSSDLLENTNAITQFTSRLTNVPELQSKKGIFSFDLTWSEIQGLKPQLVSVRPLNKEGQPRNPAYKDNGKFLTLTEFLDFAKAKAVSGVKINIKIAAYLASKKGLDIVGAVTTAFSNATLDKQSTQVVMIQSDDTSVLGKFKAFPTYKRVLEIPYIIGDAPKPSVDEIKKYADAVDVRTESLYPMNHIFFLPKFTKVVEEMHAGNISVHVSVLYNEFIMLAFDFFSDPLIELATLIQRFRVDALVTDYPATANTYLRSPCSDPTNTHLEYHIDPVEAGSLLGLISGTPPPFTLAPALHIEDIVDPPLPPVTKEETPSAPAHDHKGSSERTSVTLYLSLVATLIISLLVTGQ